MKRITKLLCVLVALVMSFSIFAFAACDDGTTDTSASSDSTSSSDSVSSASDSSEETEDGSSGSNNSSTMLSAALLSTINEIYTSETGYEFTIDAALSLDDETSGVGGATIDATILTQNDGENFNLDGEAYISTTNSYDDNGNIETYTEYEYLSALLRGTDFYMVTAETNENGMTSADIQSLIYAYTDLSSAASSLTENDTLNSYLDLYDSGEYDGIITAISNFAINLISNMTGVINRERIPTDISGTYYIGYSLSYNIAEVLLEYVTAADSFLTVINEASTAEYTVSDLLGDATVQTLMAQYLDGMTGKDIYEIINFITEILNAAESSDESIQVTAETAGTLTLPEGTTDQSAYDYIMALAADDNIGNYVLNSDEALTYVSMALDLTGELKSAFESATIEVEFIINSSKSSLSSITFDIHDLTINGCDIDLDFDVSMESKEVTLTDVSGINYYTSTGSYGSATIDETRYTYYVYTIYDYSDGTAELEVSYFVYEYDETIDDYDMADFEFLYYSVEYTTDDNGTVTAVTLTDISGDEAEPVTYTVEDNGITLSFYDDLIEIAVLLG